MEIRFVVVGKRASSDEYDVKRSGLPLIRA
jgi:hypothetical protein